MANHHVTIMLSTPASREPLDEGPLESDSELLRWRELFSGDGYYYGEAPGPLARRAVRYHRAFLTHGGSALDAGCGEGQDLAFLAEQGYLATGLELTPEGAAKTRRLLEARGLTAEVLRQDLREGAAIPRYDLVLAVNSLQFLGARARAGLDRLMAAVVPGGVIGLSLFARSEDGPALSGTLFFISLEELLECFRDWQPIEAAKLWQWNLASGQPQAFVTLIARKTAPVRPA